MPGHISTGHALDSSEVARAQAVACRFRGVCRTDTEGQQADELALFG